MIFQPARGGVEHAIRGRYAMRKFMKLDIKKENMPDVTTLLHYVGRWRKVGWGRAGQQEKAKTMVNQRFLQRHPGVPATCYYAHPHGARERGSYENADKLIRRFILKGTDIMKLPLEVFSASSTG